MPLINDLSARLFLPAVSRPLTWRTLAVTAAALVAGTVTGLLRQPGAGALDTVWDEDARIFLADAAAMSPADAMLTPYQGYYHVAPRLLAEIAAQFPAAYAATVMAILAAFVTSMLAVFVFNAARAHVPEVPLRLLISVPIVVLPLGQWELPNALCNLHWPLLYASLWALLKVPAGIRGEIAGLVIVAMTVTSDLLALVYLPLALMRLACRRDRYSTILAGLLIAGLSVQFGGLIFGDNPRSLAPPRLNPVWALASFAMRPVPHMLLGERTRFVTTLATNVIAWVIVLAILAVALRRLSNARWVLSGALMVHAVALYSESVMAGGLAVPRYAAAPGLIVLAALAVLVGPRADGPRRWRAVPMWTLIGLMAVTCGFSLREDNPRAQGPSWRSGVREAQLACTGLSPDARVDVPVSPLANNVTATLPCWYLTR